MKFSDRMEWTSYRAKRERESWGRGIHADVERKIKRKKYTHRIETYRSKDEKDVEKRDMYMYNSKTIKKE